MIRSNSFKARRQRGAVLITGLVILLLMTIIGVVAMRHSLLEERMSGNFKELQRSFQAAEAGLRHGESYARSSSPNNAYSSGITDLYAPDDNGIANSDEAVPQYSFNLSKPVLREFTNNTGDTAGSAKSGSKKLYVKRYTVESDGGTAGASGASSRLRSLYVTGL